MSRLSTAQRSWTAGMTYTTQSNPGAIRIHSVSVVVPLAWLRRACYRCYFIAKVVGDVRCEHR